LRQANQQIELATRGSGLYEFTSEVERFVGGAGIESGLLTLYCRHTSCSLLIQENADPDVQRDLITFFRRLVPEGQDWMVHTLEGPDDMPAHIKTALTQTSVSVPIVDGAAAFGTWQGIYLFEHRAHPHRRQVLMHIIGE
jgi:secondary thiamine-phosphate synthase enzyme